MNSKKFLVILISSLAGLIIIGGIIFIFLYPKLFPNTDVLTNPEQEQMSKPEDSISQTSNSEPEQTDKNNQKESIKEITDANLEIYIPDFAGDVVLLVSKGETMLINSGFNSDASAVQKYIENLGIKHFNYIVGTNYHNDSIGAMSKILSKTSADYILFSNNVIKHKNSKEILDLMTKQGLIWTSPSLSANISLGDVKVTFLTTHEEGSLAVVVRDKEETFVFLSSITKFDNKLVSKLPENIDILSITEVNSEYILDEGVAKKLKPQNVIINNKEGVPLKETLNTIEPYNSQVYKLTDTSDITIISNGEDNLIKTTKTEK